MLSKNSNLFSRNQILKAIGALIAGSAITKGLSFIFDAEPAQAQIITNAPTGIFSQVFGTSANGFDKPQMTIFQTNVNDFARLRFIGGAFFPWDIATGSSKNVMNFFNRESGNVMTLSPNGNLRISGTLTQGSSRKLKDGISDLSSNEAVEVLNGLSPVKYHYKADTEKAQHIGFIAEDVPVLVATPDRKGLSPMDIVGVLTKVVQEQQQTIMTLVQEVKLLKEKM